MYLPRRKKKKIIELKLIIHVSNIFFNLILVVRYRIYFNENIKRKTITPTTYLILKLKNDTCNLKPKINDKVEKLTKIRKSRRSRQYQVIFVSKFNPHFQFYFLIL